MDYIGEKLVNPKPVKVGVLVMNLGSPDAPTASALRRYLGQFLSDPRVVEFPRALWWLVLNGVILNIRPRKSAHAYAQVWTERGSPLRFISDDQTLALRKALSAHYGDKVHVELAMRYGNPSVEAGIASLREAGATRILLLPLYPQYCASTTASTYDAVFDYIKHLRVAPELRTVGDYHAAPGYISALAASVNEHVAKHGQPDKLLFSFHGIPKRYTVKGDPYGLQCQRTAECVAEKLALAQDQWALTFQSRFGRDEWLKPATDDTLRQWGKAGIGHIAVICPGFSADCLETLEEIKTENRAYFLESGGKIFHYIAALNDRDDHIQFLTELVGQHIQGWV